MNFCTTVPVNKIQNTTATSSTFAFDPNVREVKLSYPVKLNKDTVSVKTALWQDKQWVELVNPAVKFDTNDIAVGIDGFSDGFYKISVSSKADPQGTHADFYMIISSDWKKDLLAYCRSRKEQIETNPDPQLFPSSIVISHIDNLLIIQGRLR